MMEWLERQTALQTPPDPARRNELNGHIGYGGIPAWVIISAKGYYHAKIRIY